jgi:hypothetical protein
MPRGIKRPKIHQRPVFVLTSRCCRSCASLPTSDEANKLDRALGRAKIALRSSMPAALELPRSMRPVRLQWTCTECAMGLSAVDALTGTRTLPEQLRPIALGRNILRADP